MSFNFNKIAIKCQTKEEKIAAGYLLGMLAGKPIHKVVQTGVDHIEYPYVYILTNYVSARNNIAINLYKVYQFSEIHKLLLDIKKSVRKTITIDGKDIEISEESFEELKKQLCSP